VNSFTVTDIETGIVAMTPFPKVTVLIAHDSPLLAAGLAAAFRTREEIEVIAGGAAPARAADVIVADFDSGVKIALEQDPRILPVMIVSHEDGEAAIRQALESGVRGYLLTGSPIESIIDGARTVARGGIVIDPFVISKVMSSLNAEPLTRRELEVLSLLMRGLTDKQIAGRLGNAVGTIKYHVKQLRNKLDAGSRTEAILIAQRRGLFPREAVARGAESKSVVQPRVRQRVPVSLHSALRQSSPRKLAPSSAPGVDTAGERPCFRETLSLQS
jgi:DNA-binding NarL/FixJ family response regulator